MTTSATRRGARRGFVIPTVAVCIVLLFIFVALVVDLGLMAVARTQCQQAADAAAMSGARALNGTTGTGNPNNVTAVDAAGKDIAKRNSVLGQPIDETTQVAMYIGSYDYNSSTTQFELNNIADASGGSFATTVNWTAARAVVSSGVRKYGFAQFFNMLPGVSMGPTYTISAIATSAHRPRDVGIILDFSGSTGFNTDWSQSFQNGSAARSRLPFWAAPNWYANTSGFTDPAANHVNHNSVDFGVIGSSKLTDSVVPAFGHYAVGNGTYRAGPGTPGTSGGNTAGHFLRNTSVGANARDNLTLVPANQNPACILDFWAHVAEPDPPVSPIQAFYSDSSTTNPAPSGDNPPYINNTAASGYAHHANELGIADWTVATPYPPATAPYTTSGSLGGSTILPAPSTSATGFKGYTRGPGYWGATFFLWPPNMRTAWAAASPDLCTDWRQRFFFIGTSSTTQAVTTRVTNNAALYTSGTSNTTSGLCGAPGDTSVAADHRYQIDYDAITRWIIAVNAAEVAAGRHAVAPTRLRCGRIMYYDAIPTDINAYARADSTTWCGSYQPSTWRLFGDTSAGEGTSQLSRTDKDMLNRRFWMRYIDYVLMVRQTSAGVYRATRLDTSAADDNGTNTNATASTDQYVAYQLLHGDGFPWGSTQITDAAFDPRNNATTRTDNPQRPRLQFWFGPLSMADFCTNVMYLNHWPGNLHQAPSWGLKAGIDAALSDIENNHPNDFVTLALLSNPEVLNINTSGGVEQINMTNDPGRFNRIRAPLGRSYVRLKGSLWFPPAAMGSSNDETTWMNVSCWDWGNTKENPYARGSTAWGMALMQVYNQFSSNTTVALKDYSTQSPNPLPNAPEGESGRGWAAGAAQKVLIFLTDGDVNTAVYASNFVNSTNSSGYFQIRVRAPGSAQNELPTWVIRGADGNATARNNVYGTNNNTGDSNGGGMNNTSTPNCPDGILRQLCKDESQGGLSMARKPVLVHALAFGTFFSDYTALEQMQVLGKTQTGAQTLSSSTTPAGLKIINQATLLDTTYPAAPTNSSQWGRITALKQVFTVIMQDGIQLSLVE